VYIGMLAAVYDQLGKMTSCRYEWLLQSESVSYPKGKSNFAPHCVQPYVLYSHTTVPPGCAIIYTEHTVFLTAAAKVLVDHIRAEQ